MAIINLDIQNMDIDDLVALHVEINTELFKVAPVFEINDMLIKKGKRKYIKKTLKGWTPDEVVELIAKADSGMSAADITATMQKRTVSAVRHALNRCGYFAVIRGGRYAPKTSALDKLKVLTDGS